MYLHTTAQVSGHVFAYYGSSERSCICILQFQVSGHVFVYYGPSDQTTKTVSIGTCGNYQDCFYWNMW
jgi:hypothetical protein